MTAGIASTAAACDPMAGIAPQHARRAAREWRDMTDASKSDGLLIAVRRSKAG